MKVRFILLGQSAIMVFDQQFEHRLYFQNVLKRIC